MKKPRTDPMILARVNEGYDAPLGAECPYYATSPSGDAWMVGTHIKSIGRLKPWHARTTRGAGRVAVRFDIKDREDMVFEVNGLSVRRVV